MNKELLKGQTTSEQLITKGYITKRSYHACFAYYGRSRLLNFISNSGIGSMWVQYRWVLFGPRVYWRSGADFFDGFDSGLVYLMRIMDVVGVSKWEDLKGKYCRIAIKNRDNYIKIIGNIISDKWFDPVEFFKKD